MRKTLLTRLSLLLPFVALMLLAGACSRSDAPAENAITVGSADFAESQLVATLYAQALEHAGLKVTQRLNIGSREVYMQALQDGSIDVVPEYSGALLAYLDRDSDARTNDEIRAGLEAALPSDILALQASDAQNRDQLVVPAALAEEHDLHTISDLAPLAGNLTLASGPEWRVRFTESDGTVRRYGFKFGEIRVFDSGGPLTLAALTGGQAQVGNMFSSDPAVPANDLVPLEDDQHLYGEARLLPLVRAGAANEQVREVLDRISAELVQDALVAMNGRIGRGEDITVIASDWLSEHGMR